MLFWLLAVRINRDLAPAGAPVVNLPLAFLSLNYAVLCYFTSGTDLQLVLLSASVFVAGVVGPTWRVAGFLLPFLPLVRPELAVALLGWLVWNRWKTGSFPWLALSLTLLVNSSWLLFRIFYYAELFPITFYLEKIVDVRQGLLYFHDTFAPYHLYELMALGGIVLALVARFGGVRSLSLGARVFVALVVVAQLLYTVKIGGDGRHFRYLAFPVTASLLALGGLAERWTERAGSRWVPVTAGLATAALSFAFVPRQLDRHPAFALDTRPRFVDKIADAAHHRTHRSMVSPLPWGSGAEIEIRTFLTEWRGSGGPDASLPVRPGGICYRHYVAFDTRVVHSYGLTDGVLARVDMPSDRPAHKEGLKPMARDIARVLRWWGRPPQPGMYAAAVSAGIAAPWMARNLETLQLLERKLYNRHDFVENLGLALRVRERIDPG